MADELLSVRDLCVYYPVRSGLFNHVTDHVRAVDGVTFTIEKGQSYGDR